LRRNEKNEEEENYYYALFEIKSWLALHDGITEKIDSCPEMHGA
jgi:hypothetical protein